MGNNNSGGGGMMMMSMVMAGCLCLVIAVAAAGLIYINRGKLFAATTPAAAATGTTPAAAPTPAVAATPAKTTPSVPAPAPTPATTPCPYTWQAKGADGRCTGCPPEAPSWDGKKCYKEDTSKGYRSAGSYTADGRLCPEGSTAGVDGNKNRCCKMDGSKFTCDGRYGQ